MTRRQCELCERLSSSGRGLCSRCSKGAGRERGTCFLCAKPDRLLDARRRCRWCREKARNRCPDCNAAGTPLILISDVRVCEPCALRRHLESVLPGNGTGALNRLRDVILTAEPLTARRWLTRNHDLLQDLDTGRIPMAHASLDSLPTPRAAEHLRALLISTAILDPDPGRAVRKLENALPDMLEPLTDEHRRIMTRWIRWAVVPHLRSIPDPQRLPTAVQNARRKIEQTLLFLLTLQGDGRTLTACTQYDVDVWFAGPGTARWFLSPFLTWARQHQHVDTSVRAPGSRRGASPAPADSEQRWEIAQQLVRDDHLDPVDRVAGALIVLYAQRLTRIVALTIDDVTVTDGGVLLALGSQALTMPEPFATILTQLPHRRRESTAEQLPSRWLFPGSHAGKPLTATSLGNRMRAIGIHPTRHRIAAAEQLSREIPPAMLAGILGLSVATINRRTLATQGQWANYISDRRT